MFVQQHVHIIHHPTFTTCIVLSNFIHAMFNARSKCKHTGIFDFGEIAYALIESNIFLIYIC